MNINTTQTMSIASNAFKKETDDTKKNLLKKMQGIGMDIDAKNLVKNRKINRTVDRGDDVLRLSVNGAELYLLRGTSYDMPKELDEFLENIGE